MKADPKINSDKQRLVQYYDELYAKGGFNYNRAEEIALLEPHIGRVAKNSLTLLDVGCGDGFFSEILASEFGYQVTGIDITPVGLEIARSRGIETIEADFVHWFSRRKFDVLFLRSPSFLNFHPQSAEFQAGISKALKHTRQQLIYIKWTEPPYYIYDGGSYMHDPALVAEAFAEFGHTLLSMCGNYIYARILQP